MSRTSLWWVALCLVFLACGLTVAGCGESSSDNPSEKQLEKAREEGERVAQERARVDQLEEEVRNLKRSSRRSKADSSPAAATASIRPAEAGSESDLLRLFHAPSGNVSCAITSNGALCTVDSIATTFRVEGGEAGRVESGSALARGSGELVEFGTAVNAGSITCTVPESNEPRGITCVDTNTGHGFEASRVTSRQDAY